MPALCGRVCWERAWTVHPYDLHTSYREGAVAVHPQQTDASALRP